MVISKHEANGLDVDSHFFVEKYLGYFLLRAKKTGLYITQGGVTLGVISFTIKTN